jgi:Zn-dependent protease
VFTTEPLIQRAIFLVPLLLSLTVHEFAHAWSAFRLGDDTAARAGRLSLNPLVHADLFGTILVPLLSPFPFGWAKPVPVNPARFRRGIRMGTGMVITAAAGPLSNVILAVLLTVVVALLARFAPGMAGPGSVRLFRDTIDLNVGLALFNLIPVPPLDGSRIVDGYMPLRLRPSWEGFMRIAPFLLIGVVLFGGRIIAGPRLAFWHLLNRLFAALV